MSNMTTNGTSRVKINESPMGTKRPLKVIFIGMGASGINFSYQLAKRTQGLELKIYEKNVRSSCTPNVLHL